MKLQVLVLCTGNTARTQMAEALFRKVGVDLVDAVSAGLEATFVHPLAVRVMAEQNIDISAYRSKSYVEFADRAFDYVITVCDKAAEACPTFPGRGRRLHWSFRDPLTATGTEEQRLSAFREVRDAIEKQIRDWLESLAPERNSLESRTALS
jgi:arsenate reductase